MLPVIALATLFCRSAFAQSTIRNPGDRPLYRIELEPHLLAGAFGPPGWGTGAGLGIGGRASFEVARDGFIPSINDSVSVGVGLDYLHYGRFVALLPQRLSPVRTRAKRHHGVRRRRSARRAVSLSIRSRRDAVELLARKAMVGVR